MHKKQKIIANVVVGLLDNESPDSNRLTLVTQKSENDVRLQATLGNHDPTGLPVGTVRFPLYLLIWIAPVLWLIVIPFNFIYDSLVVYFSFRKLKVSDIKSEYKNSILRVFIMGFVADFIGCLLMLGIDFIELDVTWWSELQFAMAFDPFRNVLAFIVVTLCIIFTAILIYVFNYYFCFKKTSLSLSDIKKTSLYLAVFTAPYLLYLPSIWFYR